jgi:glutathione-regulated potassium-efflux system ancillary protein KefC
VRPGADARYAELFLEIKSTDGVEVVERETFESALLAGRHALEALGFDRFRARDMANIFRRHNISITEAMIPHFKDEDRLISAAKAGRDELKQQFARDRQQFEEEHSSKGWH